MFNFFISKIGNILLIFFLLTFSSYASVCSDDYIISGGRAINLLPDVNFEIFEKEDSLIVIRGSLVLTFSNLEFIIENEKHIKRYSLYFIGENYYFDLISFGNKIYENWEQYADGNFKRGFGGVCKIK